MAQAILKTNANAGDGTSAIAGNAPAAPYRLAPANLEAEQALLGAILVNNEALHHIGDQLLPDHFYEPLHQRIFEAVIKFNDRGLIANPVTLKHYFESEGGQTEVGGHYLAQLAGAAVSVINITDYSQMIYDLALKRQLIQIGEEIVNKAYANDIDSYAITQLEAAEQKLFTLSNEGAKDKGFRPLRSSLVNAIRQAENAYRNSGLVGVTTGLIELDKMLGGMKRSDLIILAGRPSMGKTALATNMAYNAACFFEKEPLEEPATGEKPIRRSVGFFSLEMSSEQLATRILSSASGFNSSSIINGRLNGDEFGRLVRTSGEISSLPFYIDDTPALSISALRARARRLKRMNNLSLIVVDYLQLLRPSAANSNANRVQEISEITQGLKAIAKELDIPVVALSQLSRAVEQREDKRPQLSDLRESGSIEQDADVVMFVFREEYYVGREMPNIDDEIKYAEWQTKMERVHGVAEVLIAKQRNGPIGTARIHFNGDLTLFGNLAESTHIPEPMY